jgi:2-oxoglutarate ferredoxin oxidoreductase subunit gamma
MNFGNSEKKEISIRFCGAGGMGVILSSIVLGRAALNDEKNAIQTQSYGAEQRGTKVRSDILISEFEDPTFPLFNKVDVLIAFSEDAFDHFLSSTGDKSLIILNKDLIEFNEEREYLYKIPASSMAKELNNPKVMNIIMLGSFLKIANIVSKESLITAIGNSVPKRYREVNIEAFEMGYKSI